MGGYIFEGKEFAVDPGDGEHISHKVNHSRRAANAESRPAKTSNNERCIVLRARRVSFVCLVALSFVPCIAMRVTDVCRKLSQASKYSTTTEKGVATPSRIALGCESERC